MCCVLDMIGTQNSNTIIVSVGRIEIFNHGRFPQLVAMESTKSPNQNSQTASSCASVSKK